MLRSEPKRRCQRPWLMNSRLARAGLVLFGQELAPEVGLAPQHAQEPGVDPHGCDAFGFVGALAGEDHEGGRVGRGGLEEGGLAHDIRPKGIHQHISECLE